MKAKVYSTDGKTLRTITLPPIFSEQYRPDLIRKAVRVAQANRRQPYGASPLSGSHSTETWGKGRGVARVQRLMGSRRGAQSPGTVGGRKAHPPKSEKIWKRKINDKERRLALHSALAATAVPEIVRERGHRFSCDLPIVVEDGFERLDKTKDAVASLQALGIYEDVLRAQDRKVRAGKGKWRGRRYRRANSLLIVVSSPEKARGARNLPGVDIVTPDGLNAELLAPGGDPGRLTLYTEGGVKGIGEKGKGRETKGEKERKTKEKERKGKENERKGRRGDRDK